MKRVSIILVFFFVLIFSANAKAFTLYCWGFNNYGQLGTGDTNHRYRPTEAAEVTAKGLDLVQVSLGADHTCALAANGTVWCWGYNGYGQLGDGTTTERHSPVQVDGIDNALSVASGVYHTCALAENGTVWCWGYNEHGQLGDGTTADRHSPVQTKTRDGSVLTNIVKISAGLQHTCAVAANGTAWCWGYNYYGQLGDGTTVDRLWPVRVVELDNVVDISASWHHTCALASNGTVWCWGWNQNGQLGDGTVTDQYRPVRVRLNSGVTLTGISDVTAGIYHTCALANNGTVWCWGGNGYGQLGDGTWTNQCYPVRAVGLDGAVTASVSGYHACVLIGNGTVWCWGANGDGQLGTGDTNYRNVPTDIGFTADRLWEGGGYSHHSCALTDLTAVAVSPENLVFTRPDQSKSVSVSTTTEITSVTSSDPSVFEIKNDTCTDSSSDCTFDVVFRPKALKDYSGTITITYSGGSKTIPVEAHLSTEAEAPVACAVGDSSAESRSANKAFLIVIRKGSCIGK